eukprot:TRINITY_DN48015_c0_g1_i1.p1 TRINITY_DN48015_c0_g1~~TRINITY_DN48015_c0_g1_i1.p1  ORF type:complete len:627 (+),score=231.62 TRINITY_DN48015_c0_g1_i1:39-1919(+)
MRGALCLLVAAAAAAEPDTAHLRERLAATEQRNAQLENEIETLRKRLRELGGAEPAATPPTTAAAETPATPPAAAAAETPVGGAAANSAGGGRDSAVVAAALRVARDRAAALRKQLLDYWNGDERPLHYALHLSPGVKGYDQALQFHSDKFARALVHGRKFVVGVFGDSVAAAHDNCNYDSYQQQLERTLAPLWESTGMSLHVRNAGQGGGCSDAQQNQIWCLRHMLGDDVDAIQISHTFTDLGLSQTGHPSRAPTPSLLAWRETLVRWSLMQDNRPAVTQIFVGNPAGGALVRREMCKEVAGTDSFWSQYSPFGFNSLCMVVGVKAAGYKYQGTSGMIGDGLHNTTRYGLDLPVGSERRQSLGVMFRNWHPGPLGFELMADAYAYFLAAALLRAADAVEAAIKKGDPLGQRWPASLPGMTARELPPPLYCPKYLCSPAALPSCNYVEQPSYGVPQAVITSEAGWRRDTPHRGPMIPRAELEDPRCPHLDHCTNLVATAAGSVLTVRLPPAPAGLIFVCCNGRGCMKPWSPSTVHFRLDKQPLTPWNLGGKGELDDKVTVKPFPFSDMQMKCTAGGFSDCNGKLRWPNGQKCLVLRNGTALPEPSVLEMGTADAGVPMKLTHIVAF